MNSDELNDQQLARPQSLEEIRDLLHPDVADALGQLHTLPIPAPFAAQLEQRVRERARSLQQAESVTTPPAPMHAQQRPSWKVPIRRLGSIAATLLVLMIVGVTLVNAAARSVPGDWLYGLKQLRNQISLGQAQTPAAKAQVALQQLQGALADLRAEIRDHRADADVLQSLAVLAATTHTAQTAANAVISAPDRSATQRALTQAMQDEETALHYVAQQRDWDIRLSCTAQLGVLGTQVPIITAVQASKQQGTIILSIEGAHFENGAQVVIDGETVGVPTITTTTLLTISIAVSQWGGQDHRVGIQNPDGTAAEIVVANGGAEHGKDHATPVPVITPGNDTHGHHGQTPTPIHGHP